MCHLLGESGPGKELERAEGAHEPTAAPVWKAGYMLLLRERRKLQKEQNRCAALGGSGGQRTMVSETGRTSWQSDRSPSSSQPPLLPLGSGEEGHRCLPILNPLALGKNWSPWTNGIPFARSWDPFSREIGFVRVDILSSWFCHSINTSGQGDASPGWVSLLHLLPLPFPHHHV